MSAINKFDWGELSLTLMFWFLDKLSDHCLYDGDIPVENPAQASCEKGDPEVGGKAHDQHGEHCSRTAEKQDGLASDPVRQATPVHSGEALGEGERGDEDASVEGSIFLFADVEALDHGPGIWEY